MSGDTDSVTVLRQLAADYARLRALLGAAGESGRARAASLPDLSLVAVTVGEERRTAEAAWSAVCARAAPGWVRYRSKACLHTGPVARDPAAGPPLSGEWVIDDRTSLHLRPCAREPGRFVEWTYADRLLDAGDILQAQEEAMLRETVVVLARPEDGDLPALETPTRKAEQRVLRYHVYWAGEPEAPHAIARRFARFAGFGHAVRARWIDRTR